MGVGVASRPGEDNHVRQKTFVRSSKQLTAIYSTADGLINISKKDHMLEEGTACLP